MLDEDSQGQGGATEPTDPLGAWVERGVVEDLLSTIDFCKEAAGVGAKEVIYDAHDLAVVITGGERARKWDWLHDWLSMMQPRGSTTAWPDVRERMRDVLERAGGGKVKLERSGFVDNE